MYPLALNQQTFERFNGIISRTYLIFLISHYAVWRMRWSYLHIKQIQIFQDFRGHKTSLKHQNTVVNLPWLLLNAENAKIVFHNFDFIEKYF